MKKVLFLIGFVCFFVAQMGFGQYTAAVRHGSGRPTYVPSTIKKESKQYYDYTNDRTFTHNGTAWCPDKIIGVTIPPPLTENIGGINFYYANSIWKRQVSTIIGELTDYVYRNGKWQSLKTLTIEDYGAKTSNLDNVTAILNCWINEPSIIVPKGVFKTSLMNFPRNGKSVIFEGVDRDSSIIKRIDNDNRYLIYMTENTADFICQNLTFDFNRLSNLPTIGIFYDSKNALFERCNFISSPGPCLHQNGTVISPSLCNIQIFNCLFQDIALHYNHPITNPIYSNNTTGASYCYTTGSVSIKNNRIINKTFNTLSTSHRNPYGFLIDNIRSAAPLTNVEVTNNYFYGIGQSSIPTNGGNYAGAIYLYSGARQAVINNNVFENLSYLAIGVYNSKNVTIQGNKVLSVNFNADIQNSTGVIDCQTGISNTLSYSDIVIEDNKIDTFTSVTSNNYFGIKAIGTTTALLNNVSLKNNKVAPSAGFMGGYAIANVANSTFEQNESLASTDGVWILDVIDRLTIKNNKISSTVNNLRLEANTNKTINIYDNLFLGAINSLNAVYGFNRIEWRNNTTSGVVQPRTQGILLIEGLYNIDVFSPVIIQYIPRMYRGVGSPEGVVNGNISDTYENITNGKIYIKRTAIWANPTIKNTGWVILVN